MKCGTERETRERLSNYGAMGGAVLAAYLTGSRKYPDWNPISKFAESMTVGYLGGYLIAPLLHKDCILEQGPLIGIDDMSPPMDAYAGYGTAVDLMGRTITPAVIASCGEVPVIHSGDSAWKNHQDDSLWEYSECARTAVDKENLSNLCSTPPTIGNVVMAGVMMGMAGAAGGALLGAIFGRAKAGAMVGSALGAVAGAGPIAWVVVSVNDECKAAGLT